MNSQVENEVIRLLTGLEIKGKMWYIDRHSPQWREAYGIIKGYLICTQPELDGELLTCKAIELICGFELKVTTKKYLEELQSKYPCISSSH